MTHNDELTTKIQAATGLRRSSRLAACVDIVAFFSPFGRFGRLEVLGTASGLAQRHHQKTLSRAMMDLEKSGLIIPDGQRAHQGGGTIYRIA